ILEALSDESRDQAAPEKVERVVSVLGIEHRAEAEEVHVVAVGKAILRAERKQLAVLTFERHVRTLVRCRLIWPHDHRAQVMRQHGRDARPGCEVLAGPTDTDAPTDSLRSHRKSRLSTNR